MKYEKSLFLSVFVILLSGITACNELEDVSRTVTGVTVKLPDDLSGASIANDTLTFQNISSGLSVKVRVSRNRNCLRDYTTVSIKPM